MYIEKVMKHSMLAKNEVSKYKVYVLSNVKQMYQIVMKRIQASMLSNSNEVCQSKCKQMNY